MSMVVLLFHEGAHQVEKVFVFLEHPENRDTRLS